MSHEDEKFRELFSALKCYGDNKEKYINEVVDNIVFLLINRRKNENGIFDDKKIEIFSNYVKSILTDLYEDYVKIGESENNITSDIEYVGSGFTSITFRVGDNVIKIGKTNYDIKPMKLNSIYQVPIYIKESYEVGQKLYFNVEVAPYVDTTNITYEDTYKAYSNIRSLGYIWNDPKEDNLGRIISTRGCKINGKDYVPSIELKKSDLVVIDLQDIAYVGEETSDIILEEIAMMSYNKNVYIFENKYIAEQKAKKFNKK